jgi:hypothetical protein
MLKEYIGERRSGLLFCSKTGKPLQQSNILRRSLHPILANINQPKCGSARMMFQRTWNIFGWAMPDEEVGDLYSQLENNIKFRKEVAERIGLGFDLPPQNTVVGPDGPKVEVAASEEVAVNC